MKIFWISIILFALLTVGITYNSLYMHRTAESIKDMLDSLDTAEDRTEKIASLEKLWAENRNRIEFTIGIREVTRIEELIIELKWANEARLEPEFQAKRALLISATEELIRHESLSLSAVF